MYEKEEVNVNARIFPGVKDVMLVLLTDKHCINKTNRVEKNLMEILVVTSIERWLISMKDVLCYTENYYLLLNSSPQNK